MKVTGTLYWSSTAMTWDTDSWFAVSCIIFLNQWEGVDFACYVKSDSKRIHAANDGNASTAHVTAGLFSATSKW